MILVTCQVCGCENQIPEGTNNWEEIYCELCGEQLDSGLDEEEHAIDLDEIPF